MNLVIDCSFIMSSILPDEDSPSFKYSSHKIHAPSIFYLECGNVLASSLFKKSITETQYQEYFTILKDLPISIDKFSSTPESLYFISKLIRLYKLSSYDASYLELAIRINAKLATFDKAIMKACEANQIEVIN